MTPMAFNSLEDRSPLFGIAVVHRSDISNRAIL
jgi:hypothetical protein